MQLGLFVVIILFVGFIFFGGVIPSDVKRAYFWLCAQGTFLWIVD